MALGVVRAIRDLGLSIPGDVSLIAHDDVFPWLKPENFSVPLTTTRSSIRAAGQRIAERLAAKISGLESEPRGEVWPVDLVVRGIDRRREIVAGCFAQLRTGSACLELLILVLHLAGGLGVDEAEAEIGVAAGLAEIPGGGGKRRLDPVGRAVGRGVDQVGDRAGDDRRRRTKCR